LLKFGPLQRPLWIRRVLVDLRSPAAQAQEGLLSCFSSTKANCVPDCVPLTGLATDDLSQLGATVSL
jgi:hypothetical protein